ncbi:hypothetical protein IRJ41_011571, partial [Triplophysa rosa]
MEACRGVVTVFVLGARGPAVCFALWLESCGVAKSPAAKRHENLQCHGTTLPPN